MLGIVVDALDKLIAGAGDRALRAELFARTLEAIDQRLVVALLVRFVKVKRCWACVQDRSTIRVTENVGVTATHIGHKKSGSSSGAHIAFR